ncbi:MAG TPA: DUF885 domain-containing protein [Steroidobacteraceae bacterium]|nr:DUF885 domain-containing protein [Steroidobacteraceae bacterium]
MHPPGHRRAFRSGLIVVAACATAACAPTPPQAPPPAPAVETADSAFERIARRYLDEAPALRPVRATEIGDHRFDARLDDIGAAARDARVALAESLLAQLAALDAARLSRAHQVDAALLRHELQYEIWRLRELADWRWNPLLYTDLAGGSVYTLLARDFAPLPERLANAGARLQELPRFLAQVRETLEPARVPKIHAETAVKQNPGVLSLIDELVVPQLGVLPAEEQARLKAVIERARTAISQHQIWLEKRLLPEAKGDFRLGAPLYDVKLRFALASPLSRGEIRGRAEAELARARGEMYGIARDVLRNRPRAPATPDAPTAEQQQAAIVAALELAYAERPSREKVFDFARSTLASADAFVRSRNFVTVYDDPLEIIPMPEFQRGVALAYCDSPGPLDKGLKTYYAVSPIPEDWNEKQVRSFLREYNNRSIHNLTIHEAMPGHYLQLTHSNRYDSTLRAVLASGTFVEGWAVYTERLMVEQGYLDGDPLMRLIRLKWYLRSIGNAILDQAVHVEGMSREDAMRLMTRDTFQEEREAAGKWVRAQLTSAQLPTYFVGANEHFALREEAERRWGRDFALQRYHDTVLSFGSPPVRYVRALMFDLPVEP